MKHSKHFIPVFLLMYIISTFTSCKKGQPSPGNKPPGNKPPDTVSQTIKAYVNDDFIIKFNYNGQAVVTGIKLLSSLVTGDTIETYHIAYDTAGRIISLRTDSAKKILVRYIDPTLVRADLYDGEGRKSYTNYYYENGRLGTATIYRLEEHSYKPFHEFRYSYDAQDNLSEVTEMHTDGTPGRMVRSGHRTNTYNGNKNPLRQLDNLMSLLYQPASNNNTQLTHFYNKGLELEDAWTYTYEYNQAMQPVHASISKGLPGSTPGYGEVDYLYY